MELKIGYLFLQIAVAVFAVSSASASELGPAATPPPGGSMSTCTRPGPARTAAIKEAQALRSKIPVAIGERKTRFDITELEYLISSCKLDPQVIGATPGAFKQWRRQSFLIERQNLRPQLLAEAKHGTASKTLERYAFLTNQIGDTDPVFQQAKAINARGQAQQAARCARPVDISSKFGATRNQGSAGWCYGFVAADLVSFKLGKRISAADISSTAEFGKFNMNLTNKRTIPNLGGSATDAIKRSAQAGFCLESNFRSNDKGSAGTQAALNAIYKMKQLVPERARACEGFTDIVRQVFPTVSVRAIGEALSTSFRPEFLDQLRNEACKPRIPAGNLVASEIDALPGTQDHPKLFSAIDEEIASGRPIGIAISSDSIQDGMASESSKPGTHAVLVVGRRFNPANRQCEYLIRNSWGPSCATVSRDLQCDPKTGNTWIPRESLEGGLSAVYKVR